MRKLKFTLLALIFAGVAHAAPTAQEILASADAVRNPDYPFGVTNTLIEYRNGKQLDTSTLAIYSKAEQNNGQFRSLLRFVAPARDANKLMLKTGNDLWYYDPSNKASLRISPQQRLLGQAANGDTVSINLAKDYKASLTAEEDIVDGEKKSRHCYKLDMTAISTDVTYHRIEMWVETSSKHPIKARFFTESGSLLKTAYYRRYQTQLGRERPTETVIIDGLDPTWVTVMRFTDWAKHDVPDAWLQRDYLPRFKPE